MRPSVVLFSEVWTQKFGRLENNPSREPVESKTSLLWCACSSSLCQFEHQNGKFIKVQFVTVALIQLPHPFVEFTFRYGTTEALIRKVRLLELLTVQVVVPIDIEFMKLAL
mmetsp:Transcript_65422/g.76107  ORF Transcript_65422/g.76107 Transcript_65422/m.76107 type:complete len:111 (-) Transcript_65422:544-876(-)